MANQSLYLGCSPCKLDLRRNNEVLRHQHRELRVLDYGGHIININKTD